MPSLMMCSGSCAAAPWLQSCARTPERSRYDMTTVHFDPTFSDDDRRAALYAGDLLVFSPTKSSLALVEFAKQMVAEAFAPLDPERAQFDLPVERFATILGALKPAFIHHPRCKE